MARAFAAAICGMLACLAFAGAASAKTIQPYQYWKSFDAADAIGGGGAFTDVQKVDVDQVTGDVYVWGTYGGGQGIFKFNENGESEAFSASGKSIIPTVWNQRWELKVDNSSGPTQGRFYAFPSGGPYYAFEKSGAEIHGNWPLTFEGGTCGAAVDPTDGNIWFDRGNFLEVLEKYTPAGLPTGDTIHLRERGSCDEAVDSQGNVYQAAYTLGGVLNKFGPNGEELAVFDKGPGTAVNIDLANDDVYWVTDPQYEDHNNTWDREVRRFDKEGNLLDEFGRQEGAYPGIFNGSANAGVAINKTSKVVYVTNERSGYEGIDMFKRPSAPITVPDVTLGKATGVGPSGATLHGTINADGVETTGCRFEYIKETTGFSQETGEFNTPREGLLDPENFIKVPCEEGQTFSGSEDHAISVQLSGLELGYMYFFRLTAENANLYQSHTGYDKFITGNPPTISGEVVSSLNTDSVFFNAKVDTNRGGGRYWVEWGTEAGNLNNKVPVSPVQLNRLKKGPQASQVSLLGLTPDTEYFWRFAAENDAGSSVTPEHHFKTFPPPPSKDECANALVRKQTGASRLFDCRAYELVSAADQGGYDVDSDMIPGDSALVQGAQAHDRFLYSIRYGSLPDIAGSPTTFGHDPYVAERNEAAQEWQTTYVGLPADSMPSTHPYGSPLAGQDASLTTFAFGGENICEPCFPDGSINVPLRLPGGSLVPGMEGAADPAGEVRKALSDDGSHLVFGTETKLDPQAPTGVSIYSRDLVNGGTQLVSRSDTAPISGTRTAALDVSADGSRVLIGKWVRDDSAGNEYFDLYMHVGTVANSVKVVETASGVLYNGMNSGGSQVYFSTAEALAGDADTSVDLYRAEVGSASATVSRVSTGKEGTEGKVDTCTPAGTPSWNAPEGEGKCGVVAFAGGAGVANGSGAVYFVSPEQLDGSANGIADEANLYVANVGQAPHFIATINSDNVAIEHGIDQPEVHSYEDFQVTPSGQVAAFTSARPLAGAETNGHTALYRYAQGADQVICLSCASEESSDTGLSPSGSNLTDDGRVFFTTSERLGLEDTNKAADAYEWEDGQTHLISSGTNAQGSRFVSVSRDGTDAFFFTRDSLAPQDRNGSPIKVYDARVNGGFLYIAPPFACKASDECHGPGTQASPPPPINTVKGSGRTPNPTQGKKCKRRFVKKHGKCVKRRHHRRHARKSHRHARNSQRQG
jgi:hypothetical protein